MTIHRVKRHCSKCGKPVIDGEVGYARTGTEVLLDHADTDTCAVASPEEEISTDDPPLRVGLEGDVKGRRYILTDDPPELVPESADRPRWNVFGVWIDPEPA